MWVGSVRCIRFSGFRSCRFRASCGRRRLGRGLFGLVRSVGDQIAVEPLRPGEVHRLLCVSGRPLPFVVHRTLCWIVGFV